MLITLCPIISGDLHPELGDRLSSGNKVAGFGSRVKGCPNLCTVPVSFQRSRRRSRAGGPAEGSVVSAPALWAGVVQGEAWRGAYSRLLAPPVTLASGGAEGEPPVPDLQVPVAQRPPGHSGWSWPRRRHSRRAGALIPAEPPTCSELRAGINVIGACSGASRKGLKPGQGERPVPPRPCLTVG